MDGFSWVYLTKESGGWAGYENMNPPSRNNIQPFQYFGNTICNLCLVQTPLFVVKIDD